MTTTDRTDADERFSLLEMDSPSAPTARPVTLRDLRAQQPAVVATPAPVVAPAVAPAMVTPLGIPATLRPIAPIAPAPEPERISITHQNLVAGAAAEGEGILTGFRGRGPMTRSTLLATLAEGGFPSDWAPEPKSVHAHAGRILNALNQLGYICRADTKRRKERSAANADDQALAMMVAHDAKQEGRHYTADRIVNTQTDGIPTWAARWEVAAGRGREAEVGAAFGTVIMIATLDVAGRLWIESSNASLERRIREDFEARVAVEEYEAADVSSWLVSMLVSKFRAAKLGGNWYIRRSYAADAERLLTVFARRWGQEWMLPALPVATTDQLRIGLVNGLIAEANATLDEYREKLGEAQAKGKNEIGTKAALALHGQIVTLAERAVGFGLMLGNEYVAQLRAQLALVADEIAKSIDGITQRFALIFEDLARDAKRRGE